MRSLTPDPRLPHTVLPGQEGGGAHHGQLVRRAQPLPAHCLPGDGGARAAGRRGAHRGLVEVWQEREEHGGVREGLRGMKVGMYDDDDDQKQGEKRMMAMADWCALRERSYKHG